MKRTVMRIATWAGIIHGLWNNTELVFEILQKYPPK